MRAAPLTLLAVLVVSSTAVAAETTCKVTISGAFEGTVPCKVTFAAMGGEFQLGVGAGPTPKPVTAQLLASFKEAPKPGAYGFDTLATTSASASAQERKGVVWNMAKGGPSQIPGAPPAQRKGEVALTLTATGKHPADFHGRATLTLVPTNFVGKPETAPVKVEIEF